MTPIQQLMLGVGASKKTYMDDVFSTYLFKANGSTGQTINNGIDLSGEGGLVWNKDRVQTYNHVLWDTVRGTNSILNSDTNSAASTVTNGITFNSNGYSVNTAQGNESTNDTASWSFRKAPGFFDIVTYTGNSTNRTISHNLGCKPGMILFKNLDAGENWRGYHRELGATHNIEINNTNAAGASSTPFNNTEPTSTTFSVGTDGATNGDGQSIVAYVFAGGESTQSEAVSVDFDGSGDYVKFEAASSGIAVGTGNFTCEFWVKLNADVTGNDALIDTRTSAMNTTNGFQIYLGSNRSVYGYANGDMFGSTTKILDVGTWYHIAVVRPATNVIWLYVDGNRVGNQYGNDMTFSNSEMVVGANAAGGTESNVKISNLRLTKGQALYTSSFRPSTEPLTTTSQGATASNVKILAFNNSSVTGGTVVPATVNSSGDPTASTDSPFDDPAGFVFGENEDQNVIKCGSYIGATAAVSVNLGWEPSWVMVKRSDSTGGWRMYDNMRGLTDSGDPFLYANATTQETTPSDDRIKVTSTGFETCPLSVGDSEINNGSSSEFIFLAIRRPDGYVGKPADAGTDVFAMDTGNNSSTIPAMDSGFPVDMALYRQPASTEAFSCGNRLMGTKYVVTSTTATESNYNDVVWDSNAGFLKSYGSNYQSWMWKRHAGFDVVTYEGNQKSREVKHNLNAVPEMIWSKDRSESGDWIVYHKGLNAGTSGETPAHKFLYLNKNDVENGWVVPWNDTEPTSVWYPVQASTTFNKTGNKYLTMLFSSVDGISKVGSYTGNGTSASSTQTITLGFQPRFLIVKGVDENSHWSVFDTTRGWGSGTNDAVLELSDNGAQSTGAGDVSEPTSTGFTVRNNYGMNNKNNKNYIYYAHA